MNRRRFDPAWAIAILRGVRKLSAVSFEESSDSPAGGHLTRGTLTLTAAEWQAVALFLIDEEGGTR